MPRRHFSDYRHTHDFTDEVIASCPSCHRAGFIFSKVETVKLPDRISWTNAGTSDVTRKTTTTFRCPSCGRITENLIGSLDPDASRPRFAGHDLYLQIPCCGNLLWALNKEHIDFLESYVEAELRERNIADHDHHSLIANLPKWICLGKNRSEVIKKLRKLREMADEIR